MSVEGILFYGVTIPGDDPGWRRLRAKYDEDDIPNTSLMLVEHFHADLLNEKQWTKRFRQWAGDYLGALSKWLPGEEVFGGCRLNSYGDLRSGTTRYYVAVCEAEIMGRAGGTRVDPSVLASRRRRDWDSRLRRFCERIGVGSADPRWQLVFWWC